jgi:hypothetical protein
MSNAINGEHRMQAWSGMTSLFIGILCSTSVSWNCEAAIIHVSKDGSDGDGLTWTTAAKTISGGIDLAQASDEIWIRSGTYEEDVLIKMPLTVYGGFEGSESNEEVAHRNPYIFPTIIQKAGIGIRTYPPNSATQITIDGLIIQDCFTGIEYKGTGAIANCIIRRNTCHECFGYSIGLQVQGSVIIENCEITQNINPPESPYPGAGIRGLGNLTILNSTIADNYHGNHTDGIAFGPGVLLIRNCIVRDAVSDLLFPPEEVSIYVDHSNILGTFTGEGNIDEDPRFKPGSYHLAVDSPCIDSGTSGPDLDLGFRPRPVDIPGVGREGEGAFDMGAYEFQLDEIPTPTPTLSPTLTPTVTPTPIESDLNRDGRVDSLDLLIFKREWGKEVPVR